VGLYAVFIIVIVIINIIIIYYENEMCYALSIDPYITHEIVLLTSSLVSRVFKTERVKSHAVQIQTLSISIQTRLVYMF